MTATKTTGKIEMALVVRAPRGTTLNGLPAITGSYVPWSGNLARFATDSGGYRTVVVERCELDASTLLLCKHHQGLAFQQQRLLDEHLAVDAKRIAELREQLPGLDRRAVDMDRSASEVTPGQYERPVETKMRRDAFAAEAKRTRGAAEANRRELAALAVSEEA